MIKPIESFYGLKRDPFLLTADRRFSFSHDQFARAFAYLKYAVYREEGFIMVTGRPGTGKTTLISEVLHELDERKVVTAVLVTSMLAAHDLLHMVASSFGLNITDSATKSSLLLQIESFLLRNHQEGKRAILVVDEAQDLGKDAIEELRLLSNLVRNEKPLLQIFLLGQDELQELVSMPELEQLRQRIIASARLGALNEIEVISYVTHRLEIAGWTGDPAVSREALKLVCHYSEGIPRKINLICNRLLLHGYVEDKHRLGRKELKAIIDELVQERLIDPGSAEYGEWDFGLISEVETFLQPRSQVEVPFGRPAENSAPGSGESVASSEVEKAAMYDDRHISGDSVSVEDHCVDEARIEHLGARTPDIDSSIIPPEALPLPENTKADKSAGQVRVSADTMPESADIAPVQTDVVAVPPLEEDENGGSRSRINLYWSIVLVVAIIAWLLVMVNWNRLEPLITSGPVSGIKDLIDSGKAGIGAEQGTSVSGTIQRRRFPRGWAINGPEQVDQGNQGQ